MAADEKRIYDFPFRSVRPGNAGSHAGIRKPRLARIKKAVSMNTLTGAAALLPRFAEREGSTMNATHFREMTDTQKHEYCMACAMRDNHAAMSEFYAYEKYLDKSIVIVKGRKIPIGTKGVCFYVGAVNYSKLKNWWDWTIRIGFKTENGETFFTSERNIELV